MAPLNLIQGLLFTTFDTSVNIVCWLPLEVSEIVNGETWDTPFMGSYFYSSYLGGAWAYENYPQSKTKDDTDVDRSGHKVGDQEPEQTTD